MLCTHRHEQGLSVPQKKNEVHIYYRELNSSVLIEEYYCFPVLKIIPFYSILIFSTNIKYALIIIVLYLELTFCAEGNFSEKITQKVFSSGKYYFIII